MFNFPLMFFGIGAGSGIFSHDFCLEKILHVDHAAFHWSDGKILGPIIGLGFFLLGVIL